MNHSKPKGGHFSGGDSIFTVESHQSTSMTNNRSSISNKVSSEKEKPILEAPNIVVSSHDVAPIKTKQAPPTSSGDHEKISEARRPKKEEAAIGDVCMNRDDDVDVDDDEEVEEEPGDNCSGSGNNLLGNKSLEKRQTSFSSSNQNNNSDTVSESYNNDVSISCDDNSSEDLQRNTSSRLSSLALLSKLPFVMQPFLGKKKRTKVGSKFSGLSGVGSENGTKKGEKISKRRESLEYELRKIKMHEQLLMESRRELISGKGKGIAGFTSEKCFNNVDNRQVSQQVKGDQEDAGREVTSGRGGQQQLTFAGK